MAKINDKLYVFFEDCSNHQQLQTLCKTEHLPSDLTSRVEIAFKIARTVAHYHKFGLVLKALCDTSIYLRQIPDGKKELILTGLQHMREVGEMPHHSEHEWPDADSRMSFIPFAADRVIRAPGIRLEIRSPRIRPHEGTHIAVGCLEVRLPVILLLGSLT